MMSGFRPFILAILSGILSALSQPLVISVFSEKKLLNPFYASFIAWFSYVPIFYTLKNLDSKYAFRIGLVGGITYFSIVLYWLDIAMTVFGNMPQYLAIPVLSLLIIYCGLYWGFWGYLSTYISNSMKIDFAIISPFIFVALEYIRNYLLSGFPWGNIAYSQFKNLTFIQISSIGGIYLVQYVLLLINAVIEGWFRYFVSRNERKPIKYSLVLIGILLFVYSFGLMRASSVNKEIMDSVKLKISMLQGNIDQGIKKKSHEFRGSILSNYLDLIQKAKEDKPELVIWPEAAYPLGLPDEMNSFVYPDKMLLEERMPFAQIIGVSTYFYKDNKRFLHNGAFLLDEALNIKEKYYKSHLVPFGEYVPLGIPVEKFVSGIGTFIPGEEIKPASISINGKVVKNGILICYEGIFPEISREHSKKGANLLVNLTNDAWYGVSSAPYQHLSMYVFRAIENGKFLVRAANTGITAIINPYGKILSETNIFERTTLSGEITLLESGTIYTKVGDLFAIIVTLLSITLFIIAKIILKKRITR